MARGQAKSNIKSNRRQPSESKDQEKRLQGIKKQQALRKSSRLQAIRQSHKQSLFKSNHIQKMQASLLSSASNIPEGRKASQRSQILNKPLTSSRKRKRGQEEQETEHFSSRIREQPPFKRSQISSSSCTADTELKKKRKKKKRANAINEKTADSLEY